MLPPLFPMTFFFSYGVNWYYACSKFTSRIFQLSSFQRTPMMFWGIPSRHRYSLILSGIIPFRSLCLHCQDVFLLVLSFVLPFRRESVTSRVRNVRCSEFFHHAIHTCSTDSIFRIRRCALRCSVRSLACLDCITMFLHRQAQICISLGRNFVRMVYHTPVGYHDCQPWLAGSTLVVRD